MSERVSYSTTEPGFYDSRSSTLGKILQAINGGAGGGGTPTPEVSIAAGFYTQSGGNNAYDGTVSGSPVTGDIIAVAIASTGDRAEITIKGKTTGGTYDMGLGVDNDPTNAKIAFTVVSQSVDEADESATTIEHVVWGTKFVRKVTPNEAQADETVSGSDVIVRVWLYDIIYQGDDTGPGVTNNSTVVYSDTPPMLNHSTPPYQRHTGNVEGGFCAFERSAQGGRPIRFLKVTVTDEGAHSASQIITTPTINAGADDANPVIEYRYSIPQTTFTQGNKLTINAKAYKWRGTTPLDTADGVNAVLSPNYCPQEHLCDKAGTYGVTMAKVDPVGGNDTTGAAQDSSTYVYASAAAFATIGKAARAIRDFNATRGGGTAHDDVGGGIIELVAGNHVWLGSTQAGGYGSVPKTWLTIRTGPGLAQGDAAISSISGDNDAGDRIKLENVKITSTTSNTFGGTIAMWLHKVWFATSGTGLFTTTNGRIYSTECKVVQFNQGFKPVNNGFSACFPLVRGCDLTGFAHQILLYTAIGNTKRTVYAAATLFITEVDGMTLVPQPRGWICAFNTIYGWPGTSEVLVTNRFDFSNTHGGAIIQNIFENAQAGTSAALADIASSDNELVNTPIDNILIWHNVFVGQRVFVGYNDLGTTTKWRRYWSQIGNYFDRWANKGDTHPPTSANRIGAWQVTNNVGTRGNQLAQNMVSIPGSFYAEFAGVDSHQPPTSSSESFDYPAFVAPARWREGIGNGAGDGNYRTQAGSPLRDFVPILVLPYDIEGNARTLGHNDAGAFTSPA